MFCQKCGTEGMEGGFCQKCGQQLGGEVQAQQTVNQQPQYQQPPVYQQPIQQPVYQQPPYQQPIYQQQKPQSDFSQYSEYYQRAFKIIEESDGAKSGGFNWAGFLFGSLWALFKGAWVSAIVSIILIVLTGGIAAPIYWIIYGVRGNKIMYNVKIKKKQVLF